MIPHPGASETWLLRRDHQASTTREADTSDMRGGAEETNRTGRRKLRRSASVALAILLFPLLTVSPSRATCQTLRCSPSPTCRIARSWKSNAESWSRSLASTGPTTASTREEEALAMAPGNERPMKNIDVDARAQRARTTQSWSPRASPHRERTRAGSLPSGSPTFHQAGTSSTPSSDGTTGGGGYQLFLQISEKAPEWPT